MKPPPPEAVARFRADCHRLLTSALEVGLVQNLSVALAVSGGRDSMAMLALAAAAYDEVAVATFDHGLRLGSDAEAAMVASVCARFGLPHTTLVPKRPIPTASLQANARQSRYDALATWAKSLGIYPVLTAHHADDQAETLLMRLNRASGLTGLSAIRSYRFDYGIVILRPLLDWTRAELHAVVDHCGIPFVDDPSNDDRRYDRVRMRALLKASPELDVRSLAASARYLAEAEDVLRQSVAILWSERWRGPGEPFPLDDLARELRRRLVKQAIIATRDGLTVLLPAFTEASNIEPLLDALAGGRSAVQGGVIVRWTHDGWTFAPAPPRRSH